MAVAALDRLAVRRHRRHHLPAPQPIGAVILIIENEIEQQAVRLCHGRNEPGGEAVRIHGDPKGYRPGIMLQPGKALPERGFEERDLIDVPAQALADLGCEAGLAAHDEDGADPLLQELDPLGHGRGRHVQMLGRLFETAGPDHGREG